MKTQYAPSLLAAFAAAAFWTTPVLAQHSHDEAATPAAKHDDSHSHGEMKPADNFAAAIREIGERMIALKLLIDQDKLDDAHVQSDEIGALAKSLGALSLKPGSGVDKAQVKNMNKAGKALAEISDALHDAVENHDSKSAKKAFEQMSLQFEVFLALAPAKFFCPMHCEGAKTYDKPGECPVCNMALKKQTSDKFSVDVKPIGGKIESGTPANFLFTLKDPTGLPVKSVEIVHEKPLHLLMVSKDLSWYAHEHPVLQPDGTFTFTFTFPAGGEYTLFNNFTPKNVGMQVVPVTITVEGASKPTMPLIVDSDKPKTVDGYSVSLDTGGPIKTGVATHMAYTITKDGKPVDNLQPYLGAVMGHLVIMSQDMKEFVHSHPHEGGEHGDEHGGAAAKSGGLRVDFETHFKTGGVYKGWAQFNVGNKESEKIITVPFTLKVANGNNEEHANDHAKTQHVEVVDNHNEEMPAGVGADEESQLYLVPSGIYTQADIDANGGITANARYKGKMAKHDAMPKSGDLTCPITMTKANPNFTWIVAGKTYAFCCPPCIDEFVQMAKTNPSAIKNPEEYRK